MAGRVYPSDAEVISALVAAGGKRATAACKLGIPEPSFRKYLERNPHLEEQLQGEDGSGLYEGSRAATPEEQAETLRKHGVDPKSVVVTGSEFKTWNAMTSDKATGDNRVVEMRGVSVKTRPLDEFLLPARSGGWKAPKVPKAKAGGVGMHVVTADHHAPFHDPGLHAAFLAWLKEFRPDHGVILGDLLDLDQVSRHRRTPEWTRTMQETLDAGYSLVRDYVVSSPGTRWKALAGNHEDRLRNAIIEQLYALHGVTRPGDVQPLLSIPFLLRLDELGVEWMEANGDYNGGQVVMAPGLVARHGWLSKRGAGASARATVEALRCSAVIGHVHRQAISHGVEHDPVTGEYKRLVGVEAGTMALVGGRDGLASYIASRAPDWHAGFCSITVHKDGGVVPELAQWDGRTLAFRDWTCTPGRAK